MTPSLAPHDTQRRAILMTIGAAGCFVANDAVNKYVSQSMPGAQLILLRSVMVALLVLLLAQRQGAFGRLRSTAQPRVLVRSAADAFGTAMYMLSLFQLPLANAIAINMAAPLFMTLFAVLFLRERASPARWLAVAVGFAGVLAVVQPAGSGFNAWALLCLAGTMLHAVRDLLTRRIDASVPALAVALSTALALALLAGLMLLGQRWQPVSAAQYAWVLLGAVFLCGAYLFLIGSLRLGEVSLLAPFRYSGLLFAVLLGYGIWGDVPDAWGWAGIGLLVASGLCVLRDERGRRLAHAAPGGPAP